MEREGARERKEGQARGQSRDLKAGGGGGAVWMEHWRSGAAVGLLRVGV